MRKLPIDVKQMHSNSFTTGGVRGRGTIDVLAGLCKSFPLLDVAEEETVGQCAHETTKSASG